MTVRAGVAMPVAAVWLNGDSVSGAGGSAAAVWMSAGG